MAIDVLDSLSDKERLLQRLAEQSAEIRAVRDATSTAAAALTSKGHPVEWTDQHHRTFTVTDPDGNRVMVRDAGCWHR